MKKGRMMMAGELSTSPMHSQLLITCYKTDRQFEVVTFDIRILPRRAWQTKIHTQYNISYFNTVYIKIKSFFL